MSQSLHGLIAEFESADELKVAANAAFAAGYRQLDAYAPYPVEGLAECIGFQSNRVPLITLVGAIFGGCFGFALQYYVSVISYPLDVGGRPLFSWPAFIPITFECTILFAALSAVFGMFYLNGLPKPYHPVFNAKNFQFATRNRFFLCLEATDPLFDLQTTRVFLNQFVNLEVVEVAK